MKRRVEALSCYNKPCEEYCGAADSWYVLSIVKISVKVQPKQVQGDISFLYQASFQYFPVQRASNVPHEKARLSSLSPLPSPITLWRPGTHCFPFLVLLWCSGKPSFLRNFFPQPHDGPSPCEMPHMKVIFGMLRLLMSSLVVLPTGCEQRFQLSLFLLLRNHKPWPDCFSECSTRHRTGLMQCHAVHEAEIVWLCRSQCALS